MGFPQTVGSERTTPYGPTNMKIYTRTGDMGSTGLFGGPRVPKDDARIEAYGTVDELNASIGVARSAGVSEVIDSHLCQIQNELFSIGAELATPNPDDHGTRLIGPPHVERLEGWIDQYESSLPPLKHFILPAGSAACSALHLTRGICRRAERRVVTLAGNSDSSVSEMLVVYLNRLSDLLFVLSRVCNQQADQPEVVWVRPEL